MADWIDVCGAEEIPCGGYRVVDVNDDEVAVFNIDGELHAIEDVCTHDGGELTGGEREGYEVICPRHGARFDVRTGAVTAPPAYEPVHKFPARVHEGRIQIRDDRFD
ncbi:MAG: non-heme iron oxygenase ferredoxin subunit [Gammaproteobacteria bacterium]|nr:non-heme iron oxygenase ferredoxin subunit [Gammaproteobacteria bacterium]NIR96806.1 non-heme iron oxygenase ferredoxin subunit [Gammaproteobacteria bacterium]NIT62506.1 non-heme iron oxygenase ferredoxin subunit [Gammaproteobacteria bacterium]NIV19446.1 Rieske 2Fe-2S domain-containing protein [Gammaproteobacteria bacterium]NIX10529.1 Rieske 2Fe-2S domain-containing protein [Gammaproteobacteria bacterium]